MISHGRHARTFEGTANKISKSGSVNNVPIKVLARTSR
jgi:hypothetical protein